MIADLKKGLTEAEMEALAARLTRDMERNLKVSGDATESPFERNNAYKAYRLNRRRCKSVVYRLTQIRALIHAH